MMIRQRTDSSPSSSDGKREGGLALITAILILVLVAATAISSIGNSEQELTAGGRSRSAMDSLYAAEAGIQIAKNHLAPPTDTTSFSHTMSDGTVVQSRKRTDTSAQPLLERSPGMPPEGYSINLGSGFINETFQVNITATRSNAPTTEVEVRFGVLGTSSGGQ